MINNTNSPYIEASNLEAKGIPFAWVTLVGTKGTVTRTSGRMLVTKDGASCGTVGGGAIEHKTILKAIECLKEGKSGLFKIGSAIDNPKASYLEVAIDCGEINKRLIIIGGGHVAQQTAILGSSLGFEIVIVEKREEFTKPEIFKMASCITLTDNIEKTINELEITDRDAILALNHSLVHKKDYEAALKSDAYYIGVMASHKHMTNFIGNIEITSTQNKKFHCPIGLNVGGQTPNHVALGIMSEVMTYTHHNYPTDRTKMYRPVIVRGGGDLATAVILKLHNSGYKVISLEIEQPTVIRRTVSFAQAMYDGEIEVEGVKAIKVDKNNLNEILDVLDHGNVAIVADSDGSLISKIHPLIVVDGILAKKNLCTKIDDAPLVVALGPGFTCGVDCDVVVETKRGHYLGRVIYDGRAIENTGIPGVIQGMGKERVIHSPVAGIWHSDVKIGKIVKKGEIIATVDDVKIPATIDGKLRGLLQNNLKVPAGFKVADIDPRGEDTDHLTVTDKGRCIAGGVLEAILRFERNID
jgi:xanthine dehydrogenase accessory factor